MVIVKDAPGKAKQEIVVGILSSSPYFHVHILGVSWLFYCKVSGQHLKVAVFTSQLPWLLCVEGAGQPGREAGGLVQCGSSGYDEKGLG